MSSERQDKTLSLKKCSWDLTVFFPSSISFYTNQINGVESCALSPRHSSFLLPTGDCVGRLRPTGPQVFHGCSTDPAGGPGPVKYSDWLVQTLPTLIVGRPHLSTTHTAGVTDVSGQLRTTAGRSVLVQPAGRDDADLPDSVTSVAPPSWYLERTTEESGGGRDVSRTTVPCRAGPLDEDAVWETELANQSLAGIWQSCPAPSPFFLLLFLLFLRCSSSVSRLVLFHDVAFITPIYFIFRTIFCHSFRAECLMKVVAPTRHAISPTNQSRAPPQALTRLAEKRRGKASTRGFKPGRKERRVQRP